MKVRREARRRITKVEVHQGPIERARGGVAALWRKHSAEEKFPPQARSSANFNH